MLPASAHERQVPVQLELQQTPCWQSPDAHSAPVVQAVPGTFLAQAPLMQTFGETQSALDAHITRQAPFAPQAYGSQGSGVVDLQTPAPSHVRAGVAMAWLQAAAAQVAPLA